jgi:hypothetical protein
MLEGLKSVGEQLDDAHRHDGTRRVEYRSGLPRWEAFEGYLPDTGGPWVLRPSTVGLCQAINCNGNFNQDTSRRALP